MCPKWPWGLGAALGTASFGERAGTGLFPRWQRSGQSRDWATVTLWLPLLLCNFSEDVPFLSLSLLT